ASLAIVDGVHRRWTLLLESMTDRQFQREFIHPDSGPWTLEGSLRLYAWHSFHHLAHITRTRERHGW
ncbi:MAG: DinB family protein, partial [Blastocatellia bacterium]|nr:DinB family protein [Blastocatellia bacterium]